jgi:hypothetical protein
MKITATFLFNTLNVDGDIYFVSNRLRTVRDGTRPAYDVVYSIPDGLPYDPQPFPKGLWKITSVEWQKERGFDPNTYGPVKIRTNAWQMVKAWMLDEEGDYTRETDQETRDTCYWIHYSPSKTTLGCIRLDSEADAVALARRIEDAMRRGEPVELEVI